MRKPKKAFWKSLFFSLPSKDYLENMSEEQRIYKRSKKNWNKISKHILGLRFMK